MIKKYLKKGNTAVYIDASNLFFTEKKLGWNIDFKKLFDYFKKNCTLKFIKYYSPYKPYDINQKKFFTMLKKIGYKVILKEIKVIKDKIHNIVFTKGNLDIEIAIDILEDINQYKNIILFSGDSDFESLLKKISKKGKNIIIIASKETISKELLNIGSFVDIESIKNLIILDKIKGIKLKYEPNEEILFFISL